jgi:hypothetical protein
MSADSQDPAVAQKVCPLEEADDRFQEAHYFINQMMHEYHEPEPFRWNLNAFLQALRSVTFVLQKTLAHEPAFSEFWIAQQKLMREDELLRKFVDGRNVVVKERNLLLHSKVAFGVFNHRRLRVAFNFDIPARMSSREALHRLRSVPDGLIDDDRAALWEEYGIERHWYAPELGEEDVLTLCDRAWVRISAVMTATHRFMHWECAVPTGHHHTPDKCNLLTETDINPTLVEKWGWT